MKNPWVKRGIVILLAIGLMPILVNGTAKLISKVIHRVGDAVSSIFMFSAMSGEARLQGFIVICLYLIGILVLFRVFVRMGGKDDDEA